MAEETKNPVWADANANGVPDKLEAVGGLIGKLVGGIVKTLKYLGLDTLIEMAVKHAVETAVTKAVDKMDDKWFGK
jgi:hypothetical protein